MSLSEQVIKESVIKPGEIYQIQPDGRWDIFVDHHMIAGFGKCEAQFELRHIQHLRTKGFVSFKTFLGQWWSQAMELYYKALRADPDNLTRLLAIDLAAEAWKDCGIDAAEKQYPSSYEKFGGSAGYVGMMNQYYDFSYQYDRQFWKLIGVEQGFGRHREVMVAENNKVRVFYTGKPDLMIIENGRVIPVDHKTKDAIDVSLSAQFKPHAQTAGYIVAGQILADKLGLQCPKLDRVLINVAARNEPTDAPRNGKPKRPRYLRIPVSYSQQEIDHWRTQILLKATRLRHCIETNEWIWNDSQCHIYGGCEYRDIHNKPEGSWPIVIQSNYIKTDPWVNYETED